MTELLIFFLRRYLFFNINYIYKKINLLFLEYLVCVCVMYNTHIYTYRYTCMYILRVSLFVLKILPKLRVAGVLHDGLSQILCTLQFLSTYYLKPFPTPQQSLSTLFHPPISLLVLHLIHLLVSLLIYRQLSIVFLVF